MTIDPLLSLALNIHTSKGIYALLIGSGVSRSAKIPTGWEVVLDLIRRLAKLKGEDCEPDPAAWFKATFGEEPDYSKLLDQLTTSPEQRQQILRQYFEPTKQERADGLKQPTEAHKAIARLVAGGYVRVILTTNFDRLLEQAIQDAGVTATVISTPDGFSGAVPLVHQRCVVVKLHGDYLDTRIKNTPAELKAYEKAIDRWLDRVFDEFGLVVAGWSGEWDTALRRAMERCPTRRFGFWWSSVGDPKATAISLTGARGGTIIRSPGGADQFFRDLADKVEVLDDIYPDHPLNVATNVALVKRFLGEPRQPIKLADLIGREADRVQAELAKEWDGLLQQQSDVTRYAPYTARYVALTTNLRAIAAHAAFWGGRTVVPPLVRAIVRIGHDPAVAAMRSGLMLNDGFRLPPAMVLIYAAAIGFIAADDFPAAADVILEPTIFERSDRRVRVLEQYHHKVSQVQTVTKATDRLKTLIFPFNGLLYETMKSELADALFPDPAAFDVAFTHVELLASMLSGHVGSKDVSDPNNIWIVPARFMNRWRTDLNDPLFFGDQQGDAVTWCEEQKPFVDLIGAGHFNSDWKRLVDLRRAVAVLGPQWARGF